MPQLINKTKPDNYVKTDRSLLRDKRLKPTPKLIYSLLHNLAKSCEKVFPTHFWIAIEIGIETEPTLEEIAAHGLEKARANKDRAVRKYIRENLEPLLHLGLIKAVETPGKGYDYEIYDYDPEPAGSPTLNLKVQGTLNPEVHPLYIGEREEEKEKVGEEVPPQNFSNFPEQSTEPPAPKFQPDDIDVFTRENLYSILNFSSIQQNLPSNSLLEDFLIKSLQTSENILDYLNFVSRKKSNSQEFPTDKAQLYKHKLWLKDWQEWKKAGGQPPSKLEIRMSQLEHESIQDFEARVNQRLVSGDVIVNRVYLPPPMSESEKRAQSEAKRQILEETMSNIRNSKIIQNTEPAPILKPAPKVNHEQEFYQV